MDTDVGDSTAPSDLLLGLTIGLSLGIVLLLLLLGLGISYYRILQKSYEQTTLEGEIAGGGKMVPVADVEEGVNGDEDLDETPCDLS